MNQQIIDRYTHDIWPAMSAYNADHAQAGPAAKQFFAVVGPNLAGDQFNELRSAAQGLGRQGEYDAADQTSHSNDGLTLGTVDVQSVNGGTAALNVCYTYSHSWYVNIQNTQHAPGASEATVHLVNVNNTWYLHGITDDHTVPSCSAANG
ncbi:MAG TPA: hypothetical protein VGG53_18565 [Mycobacterium sp.]|uniref:hypothetical protein n=1 Tax=Mycobacterium sp. TaxID=1785 RepID=UPI002F3F8C57